MILILADNSDHAAQWLHAQLRRRSKVPVEWVTPAQLVYAPSIVQRMNTNGGSSRFRMWDGTEIDFARVTGVINRITSVPTAHLQQAAAGDRDYAAGELHAFLLGWLGTLGCPVLNPPTPEWVGGAMHHEIGALHLAAQAGLRCAGRSFDTAEDVPQPLVGHGTASFVLDGRLIGPAVSARNGGALIGIAQGWGTRLLQVETRQEGNELLFLRATSLPDYRRGGAALVHAIAQALEA